MTVLFSGGQALDPLVEISVGPALLQYLTVGAGSTATRAVRVYRPAPTVALSGRDCLSPGRDLALVAARAQGFTPVRRVQGGRAVAYHRGCVGLDVIEPARPAEGINARFARHSATLLEALDAVGVSARIGAVAGEYCPGDYSLNDGAGHKLVGSAQRLVPGAALFSAFVVVTDPGPIREVLVGVYRALELAWDPATVGAADQVSQTANPDVVSAALISAFAGGTAPMPLPDQVLQAAQDRRDRHLP